MSTSYGLLLLLTFALAPFAHGQLLPDRRHSVALDGRTGSAKAPQENESRDDEETVRVTTSLVSVPLSVFDRAGNFVNDLRPQDFSIKEDGAEQAIAHFSSVERPFSVVLLLDTSGSTLPHLENIKQAAKSFVDQLQPDDVVGVISFDGRIHATAPGAAGDRQKLYAVIDALQPGSIDIGTRLYDAVSHAVRSFPPTGGRNAVVLFTDGGNTWGKATARSTLDEVKKADALVYAIRYGDEPAQKYMRSLAEESGGRYYEAAVSNVSALGAAFAEIAKDLRHQYTIGYYPKLANRREALRRIEVRVKGSGLRVRARRSYLNQ